MEMDNPFGDLNMKTPNSMEKLITPKIPSLKKEYLLMVKDAVLKENKLNVGDKILWKFNYQIVRSGYKRGEMNRYSESKICDGILKVDNNGFLYAESVEDLEFYDSEYRNKISLKGHYYKKVMRKSIHYFGTGFIHTPPKKERT